MKPRYYIIQRDGIFYIYPPSGGEWVAASREKEEAERMQEEKNAALAGSKVLDAEVVDDEATQTPEQAKPKKKRIPRILRPTVTLSEQDWAAVHSVLRIQGRTDVANAEAMLGLADPNRAIDRIKRGLYDIRLAEHIKAQVDAYCKAIRDPQDDDCPF